VAGPDLGEFRAQQEYLCGVIDPNQQHDDACGRAINIGGDEVDEIKADYRLSDHEQKCGADRADEHVTPH